MKAVTDQKRVARGLHLERAKYYLQARDGRHNCRWKILMLAGPEPAGEIAAIRHLFPIADLLAVDKNRDYLALAEQAGADDILCCDINPVVTETEREYYGTVHKHREVAISPRLLDYGRFDLMDIDLCANASDSLRQMFRTNWALLQAQGVMMATFSYGRDVVPMLRERYLRVLTNASRAIKKERANGYGDKTAENITAFLKSKIPDPIKMRLAYVFPANVIPKLRSVIVYRGAQMPMCAALFAGTAKADEEISYVQLEDGDFANVVLEDRNTRLIFDCPECRIKALRGSRAAKKAWATRKAKAL